MAHIQDSVDRKRDLAGSGGNSGNADKFDIHFQALCSAVEQEKFEKARSILENQTHLRVFLKSVILILENPPALRVFLISVILVLENPPALRV